MISLVIGLKAHQYDTNREFHVSLIKIHVHVFSIG